MDPATHRRSWDWPRDATIGMAVLACAFAFGCGSDSAGGLSPVPPPLDELVSVEVTPAAVALTSGDTVTFRLTGRYRSAAEEVLDATFEAAGGTVRSSGLYTAAGQGGQFTVIATDSSGLADTANVQITPAVTALHLSPEQAVLYPTQTIQFATEAEFSDGSVAPPSTVSYSTSGGSINSAGLFEAGQTPGAHYVVVTTEGIADSTPVTVLNPGGPFQSPDLLNVGFDGGDFSAIQNFPQNTPLHSSSQAGGLNGSPALEASWWPGAPDFSPARVRFTEGSRRYARVFFRMTAPMQHSTSNVKVLRFSNPNRGVIYSNTQGSWGWGWDREAMAVAAAIGVFEGTAPSSYINEVGQQYVYGENLKDGHWHSLEIEIDRDPPGNRVEVRFWFDGVPVVMPPGAAWANDAYLWDLLQWEGGVAGVFPSTLWAAREPNSDTTVDHLGLLEEYSGGASNSGSIFFDDIAVSTQRIGP